MPQPQRRPSLDPDTPMVVPIRDYLDARVDPVERRIDAVEQTTATAISGLSSELHDFKREVRSSTDRIETAIGKLREDDARSAGQLSGVQKVGVFIVGVVAAAIPVVNLFVTLSQSHHP